VFVDDEAQRVAFLDLEREARLGARVVLAGNLHRPEFAVVVPDVGPDANCSSPCLDCRFHRVHSRASGEGVVEFAGSAPIGWDEDDLLVPSVAQRPSAEQGEHERVAA